MTRDAAPENAAKPASAAKTAELAWEAAFVAVSAALGEPYEATLDALGDAGTLRAGPIVRALREAKKAARATALASTLGDVARAIEDAELA